MEPRYSIRRPVPPAERVSGTEVRILSRYHILPEARAALAEFTLPESLGKVIPSWASASGSGVDVVGGRFTTRVAVANIGTAPGYLFRLVQREDDWLLRLVNFDVL
jgi:hypothetical protein